MSLTCLSLLLKKRWQQKQERTRRIIDYLNANELSNHLDRGSCSAITPNLTIGDTTCLYNARSPFLRCAIAPSGSCENCQDYQPLFIDE